MAESFPVWFRATDTSSRSATPKTNKQTKKSEKMEHMSLDHDPMAPRDVILKQLNNGKFLGYEDQYREMRDLVYHMVTTGGSNSVLLLGPHGVGKSHLVRLVLDEIRDTSDIFRSDGLIVQLNGLLQTDDRLALKAIAKQLNLDNVVGDRVFGSFAEHLEFLLKSLNSGGRHSKPIVFILEEFGLFCGHHNQTLLYNLFDVAQSRAAPIIVVGITAELDVVESLEKRVKSRFNHRQITMFPTDKFNEYFNIVKTLLTIFAPCKSEETQKWNSRISFLFSCQTIQKLFQEIFSVNNTFAFAKQFVYIVVSRLNFDSFITELHFKDVWSELRSPSDSFLLDGLTVVETCLLIACKHLQHIYEGEAFNFEMAFHEYNKFATQNARQLKFERSVMSKAWESLLELELITPVDRAINSKILKQFSLHELQVTPERIVSSIDSLPQPVKEWAVSSYISAA